MSTVKPFYGVRGFTLLEALVALVVISIGLLGLLGLQTVAIVNTQTSEAKSLASIAADNIADRIRANPSGAEAGDYNAIAHPFDPDNDTPPTPDCVTTQCTNHEMAALDAWEWDRTIHSTLRGEGYVECREPTSPSATNPCRDYTVTVAWSERKAPSAGGPAPDYDLCDDPEDSDNPKGRFQKRCVITVIRP